MTEDCWLQQRRCSKRAEPGTTRICGREPRWRKRAWSGRGGDDGVDADGSPSDGSPGGRIVRWQHHVCVMRNVDQQNGRTREKFGLLPHCREIGAALLPRACDTTGRRLRARVERAPRENVRRASGDAAIRPRLLCVPVAHPTRRRRGVGDSIWDGGRMAATWTARMPGCQDARIAGPLARACGPMPAVIARVGFSFARAVLKPSVGSCTCPPHALLMLPAATLAGCDRAGLMCALVTTPFRPSRRGFALSKIPP